MKKYALGLIGLIGIGSAVLAASWVRYPNLIVSGQVKVGATSTPDASSILDVSSTTKGVLLPRMTTTQRDAISTPATGLEVYNTTTNQKNVYNGTAWVAAGSGSGSGSGQGIELLSNPGFEAGVSNGWSVTGGTLSAVTAGTNLMFENTTASFLAAGSGQIFESSAYAIQGLAGGGCVGSIYYTYGGSSGDYSLRVVDGSANVLGTLSLPPNSVASVPASVSFPCGGLTTSTLQLQIISNVASPGTIYLDNAHLGSNGVYQVSQAKMIGGATWPATASCTWGETGTTALSSFAAVAACTNPAGSNLKGSATAPATKIPAITFPTMPAGEYDIIAYGSFYKSGAAGTSDEWAFTDGTNTSNLQTMADNDGATIHISPQIRGHFSYTTAQSNVTIQIQCKLGSGTDSCNIDASSIPLTIEVFYYPTSSDGVFTPANAAASWSGYHTTAASWSTTSTSYTDLTVSGTPALTQVSNTNFGTVTTAASNLPGITFTPPKTGSYYVCADAKLGSSSNNINTDIQLTDGTTSIVASQTYYGSGIITVPLCGVWKATSIAPVTLKIQGKTASGTLGLGGAGTNRSDIEWSIFQLDYSQPAPVIPGSVLSSSAGTEMMERALVVNNGSTCTASAQSGSWMTTPGTRNGTGDCTMAVTAFSAAPQCTCSANGLSNRVCNVKAISAASIEFTTFVTNTATASDDTVSILCQGPR